MSRHRRPKPLTPGRAPGFAILFLVGFLIGMAIAGGSG